MNGWVENYRRFYYGDIRALVVGRTSRWLVMNVIFSAICALFLFLCLVVHERAGMISLGCTSACFGLLLLVNVLRGPTCRVMIYTALGGEPLPSIQRLRTARKVMALLKPRLLAAQGELPADEIPRRLAETAAGPVAALRPVISKAGQNNYGGGLHGWLFGLLLLNVAVITVYVFAQGLLPGAILMLVTAAVTGIAFVAAVKQQGSRLGTGLRNATWSAVVYVVACMGCGYVLMVGTIIQHPRLSHDQFAIFNEIVRVPVLKTPWVLGIYSFLGGFALIVAVVGFILLLDHRRVTSSIADTTP